MRPTTAKYLAAVFYLSLLQSSPGLGVEYAFQYDASLKQLYNSNLLLQSKRDSNGDVFGTDLEMNTLFSATAPTWSAGAGARFENWFYYGPNTDLNYQNQYIDSHYSYFTDRSKWSIIGNYINAAYISSLADATQPSGVILGVVQRESRTLSPSWSYSLSEYTKLDLSYQYNDSSYQKTSPSQGTYPPSTSHTGSTEISHTYSEHLLLTSSLSFTNYTAKFLISESIMDYVSLMAGFKYSPYQSYSINFSGGGQYTETTTTGPFPRTSTQVTPLITLGITKRFENSNFVLNYGRTISPSVNGSLFYSDSVSLAASHKFSQRLEGNLGFSYQNSSFTNQTGTLQLRSTRQQQTYYRFGGDISYTLAQHCVISAGYNYILRELEQPTGSVSGSMDAHTINLSLHYDFEPFHF